MKSLALSSLPRPTAPRALAAALCVGVLVLSACSTSEPSPATPSAAASTQASATGSASASGAAGASGTSGAAGSETPAASTPAASGSASAPAAGAGLDESAQIVPAAVEGTPVDQAKPAEVKDTSGIKGVLAWDTAGYPGPGTPGDGTLNHDHVQTPVNYAVVPAVGGQHANIWLNVGTYTQPVPTERAVHALEHGAVWITYNASLPAAEVDALRALAAKQSVIEKVDAYGQKNGNRYVLLSPWASDELPSPIVISAWGHQLRVDSASDPRLQNFIDTFRYSKTYTPEYGSPVDGVPTTTGGNPAANGSLVPNPKGLAG